jgi:hypothetical protein
MSPDEVRACYRLYAAYYTSCGISPYRRMLSFLAQLCHRIFKESFAQIAWAEPQKIISTGPPPAVEAQHVTQTPCSSVRCLFPRVVGRAADALLGQLGI